MRKILLFVCGIMMISSVAIAEETTVCANGAGTIVVGAISGREYCMSKESLNWWNSQAWCDAIGRTLFSLDDCECSTGTDCVERCPELNAVTTSREFAWTKTPVDESNAYLILLNVTGKNFYTKARNIAYDSGPMHRQHALCK